MQSRKKSWAAFWASISFSPLIKVCISKTKQTLSLCSLLKTSKYMDSQQARTQISNLENSYFENSYHDKLMFWTNAQLSSSKNTTHTDEKSEEIYVIEIDACQSELFGNKAERTSPTSFNKQGAINHGQFKGCFKLWAQTFIRIQKSLLKFGPAELLQNAPVAK